MLSTRRSRVRALGGVAMAAVVAGIGAVTFNASAATTAAPAAPAPFGPEARAVHIPLVPDAIKPPPGSKPIGAYVVVNGTQNYTCVVAAGATTGAFTGKSTPEAQLLGTGGRIHHFAGPSWQSTRDGSLVTGTSPIQSPRTGAIPELLLTVASHSGKGILDKADYINRLYTSGGLAPTTSCVKDEVKKVPYGAVYVFWDAPAA
jgi:uncharacterized protein DUF3455